MLRVYLWKEWRELRLVLLMSLAVLLVVPAGLAWALPEHYLGSAPWFAIALFLAAVVFGNELVGGEMRRGQLDVLARLPGALRVALVAKMMWLVGGVAAFGALGYLAEGITVLARSGDWIPWVPENASLVLWAVALATWVVATSCWWPSRSALPTVVFVVSIFTAPLVFLAVDRLGIHPIPLDVASTSVCTAAIGLVLCGVGFRRLLARPRERRSITAYLATMALAFAPVWGMGAYHVWRWHHVDAGSARISGAYVGPDHERAFVSLSCDLLRERDSACYSIIVDLETGSWEQVGPPMAVWQTLHNAVEPGIGFRASGVGTPALARAQCTPDGQELVRYQIFDGRSGEVVATADKHEFEDPPVGMIEETARDLSPYRTASGGELLRRAGPSVDRCQGRPATVHAMEEG